jgi:hypothetical protein
MNNASSSPKPTPKMTDGTDHTSNLPTFASSDENVENVPANLESFGLVPLNSSQSNIETVDAQCTVRKQRSDSLEEKISAPDRSRLFEWLAQHSYTEVQELVAAHPPEGFGFSVAKSTLSRFYKAHFLEIDSIRQLRLDARAYAISQINQGGDYAETLHNSSLQLLLERYFEMISHPLESIDDLKKLAAVAEKIQSLRAQEKLAARMAQLSARFSPESRPPQQS